jgi:hypothetical protein
MPEAGRPREQVKSHGRTSTQVLFLCKAELGFFSLFRNSDRLAATFLCRRSSHLLKTGFFRQVRELKIQRKIPGSAFHFTKMWKCDENNLHKKPTKRFKESSTSLLCKQKKKKKCMWN